jgi:AcrR family transcriptional regulator
MARGRQRTGAPATARTRVPKDREHPNANGSSRARPRLTQAERSALSDTRMFNAAMELISENGANRTTLREIGELAGYSRGLATYRFGSKESFLKELLGYFNRTWVDNLAAHTEGKSGLEAFIGATRALEHFLLDHSRYMRGVYTIWCEYIGGENEIKTRLALNHRRYRHDVEQWLEEGMRMGSVSPNVDAAQFAGLYCSFVFGTIFQWLADPEALDLPSLFESYRQMATRALSVV